MDGQYRPGDVVLNNWTLIRLVGEGSHGRVFEAQREGYGRIYKAALKIITIPQNQSEVKSIMADGMDEESVTAYFRGFIEELVEEFSLMAKLKGNSNIVSYEDHDVIKHRSGVGWDLLIRMEALMPLLDYVHFRTLTKKDVMQIGIDMCKALELCQRYNIIHRDIKPENIFINDSGDFKLGDFGIARTVEKTTSVLSRKGTYTYMAPEMYRGEPYSSNVDIYSLGIVLYRLLNENRTPFLPGYPAKITHSDREFALKKRIMGAQIPMPKNADGRLAEIVLKASSHNPKDRYFSPMEMREELEALLYSSEESALIYPSGDEAPIRTTEYVEPDVPIDDWVEDSDAGAPTKESMLWKVIKKVEEAIPDPVPAEELEEDVEQTTIAPSVEPLPIRERLKKNIGVIVGVCVAVVMITLVLVINLWGGSAEEYIPDEPVLISHKPPNTDANVQTTDDKNNSNPVEKTPKPIITHINDEDGRLVKQFIVTADGKITGWFDYTYYANETINEIVETSANGNVIKRTCYREDGTLSHTWMNEYDRNGNKIVATKYSENNAVELMHEFDYDKAGTNTERVDSWYDEEGNRTRIIQNELYENGKLMMASIYHIDGEVTRLSETQEYDANNNLVANAFYKRNGSLEKRLAYDYEEENSLLLVVHEYNDKDVQVHRTEYDYNEKGEETERRERELNSRGRVTRTRFFRPGAVQPYKTDPPPTSRPSSSPSPTQPSPSPPAGCPNAPNHGGYNANQSPRITTGADANGSWRRDTYYYVDGCVRYYILHRFDTDGNTIGVSEHWS